MADSNHDEVRIETEPGPGYALSGKIMLSAIVVLFAVVVFMVGLHIYARWYIVRLRRRQLEHRRRLRRASRTQQIVVYVDTRAPDRGLDRSVLDSLPVFPYNPEPDRPEAAAPPPECAVCLSEFEEDEIVRLLPRCGHTFHIECIDMWFGSHSTCPLCRSTVEKVVPHRFDRIVNNPQPVQKESESEPGSSSDGSRGKGPEGVSRTGVESEPAVRFLALRRILSMGRRSPATTSSGVGTSELEIESRV